MKHEELLKEIKVKRGELENYISQYKNELKELDELKDFISDERYVVLDWLNDEVLYPHDLVKFKPKENKELDLVFIAGVPFKEVSNFRYNHIDIDGNYGWGGLWSDSINIFKKMNIKVEEDKN